MGGADLVLKVPGLDATVHVFGANHRAAQPHIGESWPNLLRDRVLILGPPRTLREQGNSY